jgi:hypothetical protein
MGIVATKHMIRANNPQVGCNTQGIYVMRHGTMAIMSESNISNMCASKWSKMTNMSHDTSNTSRKIHNIHAQEGCHLKSVTLCVRHNADAQASAM